MNGRNVVRFALVAALVGAVIPGAAMAQSYGQYPNSRGDQSPNSGGKWWDPQTTQEQQFHRGDFEGRWVAQDRNDSNDRGGYGDRSGNNGGGYGDRGGNNGGWNSGGGYGDRGGNNGGWNGGGGYGDRGGFGFGMMALPNFLNIDQGRRSVRIADRQNNLVQVIAIADGGRNFRNQATFLRGQIRGSRLVASGTDQRGRQMTQTMQLRDRGTTLVVRTQIEGRSGRTMTFEKVYERA